MKCDSAKDVVRILFDLLEAHGVKDVVCSPGSRNAPLLLAAEARDSFAKHVVIDERSAAFAALGMSLVSRRPVALVCTSGTALLNYAPAVAEAYYQGIPLIVISADRPMEWIDQDDSQTIRQPEALRNFVKGSYTLSDREQCDRPGWYETRIANDAMLTALAPKQGPVHINVRLSPPLNRLTAYTSSPSLRVIRRIPSAPLPERGMIRELAETAAKKRILVVAGFLSPDSRLNRAILRMRTHSNVAVMAETISNLHLPREDYAIDTVLCNLDDEQRLHLAPDIVISLGGALVSRMLKEYLRHCGRINPDFEHWAIGYSHTTVDCFQSLTCRIEADPGRFMAALTSEIAHCRSVEGQVGADAEKFADLWHNSRESAIARMESTAAGAPWSDMKAISIILDKIPLSANIFISNGTPIRYAQILTRRLPHAEYCNRGVSGIDGSTSTAIGGAMAYNGLTLLLTGDTSFAYDLSALQTLRTLGCRLKIIVINNKGGGIFRFISATSNLGCRERYFCADPDLAYAPLAATFGAKYFMADSPQTLSASLTALLGSEGPAILEIKTPPEESAETLLDALRIRRES